MKKKSNNKGFSLIELIVSLAIVMIVGGSIVSFLLAGRSSVSSEPDIRYGDNRGKGCEF